MPSLTPEEEAQACDALVNLGWLETQQGLHSEGVRAIQELRHSSVVEARAVFRDLRLRKLIEEQSEMGAQTRFRWVRSHGRRGRC